MSSAQNDCEYRRNTVDQACTAFESAVAQYERNRPALEEARYRLYRARSQLDYARVCVDESEAEVDVIATQFNFCKPEDPSYYTLLAELDLASDRMLRTTEWFEKALAQHQLASEQFEEERLSNCECIDTANALCAELSEALNNMDLDVASNDPYYNVDIILDDLSDEAYRFYRLSV